MQLRMSPGGRMRFSRRRRPELPPSSVTVTIAVRLEIGCSVLISSRRRETRFLRPRSNVESPVPPPRATTLSPLASCLDWRAGLFTMWSRYDTDLRYTVARQLLDAAFAGTASGAAARRIHKMQKQETYQRRAGDPNDRAGRSIQYCTRTTHQYATDSRMRLQCDRELRCARSTRYQLARYQLAD